MYKKKYQTFNNKMKRTDKKNDLNLDFEKALFSEKEDIKSSRMSSKHQKGSSESIGSKAIMNSNYGSSLMFINKESHMEVYEEDKQSERDILYSGVNMFESENRLHRSFPRENEGQTLNDMFQNSKNSVNEDYESKKKNRTSIFQTFNRDENSFSRKSQLAPHFFNKEFEYSGNEDMLFSQNSFLPSKNNFSRTFLKSKYNDYSEMKNYNSNNICSSMKKNIIDSKIDENLQLNSFCKYFSKENSTIFDKEKGQQFDCLFENEVDLLSKRQESNIEKTKKKNLKKIKYSTKEVDLKIPLVPSSEEEEKDETIKDLNLKNSSKTLLKNIANNIKNISKNDLKANKFNRMRQISETDEEFISSLKKSANNSLSISEINESNKKDKILMNLLLNSSIRNLKINTLNTNINPKNNIVTQINTINKNSFPGNILDMSSINDIKNYFIEPNTKTLFLKLGNNNNSISNDKFDFDDKLISMDKYIKEIFKQKSNHIL